MSIAVRSLPEAKKRWPSAPDPEPAQVLSVLVDAANRKWWSIGPVFMFTSLPVEASTEHQTSAVRACSPREKVE